MLALDKDLITPDQLREALAEQARDQDAGRRPVRQLSAILVARGFLDEKTVGDLLQEPRPKGADPQLLRRQDQRLRNLLLKEGVPKDHLDECTRLQEKIASGTKGVFPRLAELMVEKGYATPEGISRLLAVQKRVVLACAPCRKRYNVTEYYPLKDYRCAHCKGELEPTGEEFRKTAMDWPTVKAPLAGDPRTLGKFRLVREVGKGGMGVVYEAMDTQLHRKVALKLMLTSPHADPQEIKLDEERFIREARLSARLKHPNIVAVYEAGVLEGRRYLAMELVLGKPLSEWRRQGSLTVRQQVSLLRDVALAVHDAHEQGVLHRDLKPANILVDSKNQPHVTDFGLAKMANKHSTLSLTGSGMLVGTPAYMSPEQARSSKSIDRRADVWSMGVMLYEILSGRQPFEGETPMEVLMKVIRNAVPRIGRPVGVDPTIEAVCMKALAKKAQDRYPKAAVFAYDLTRWLRGERFRIPGF
jgi:tRNA A-37 threonylcarbamoyl transferase component Bud32